VKRIGLYFFLLFASVILVACSPVLHITLFNNTGAALELHAADENTVIAPNQFSEFRYPWDSNRVFRLASGGCEYLYDVPLELPDYAAGPNDPKFGRGVQAQVEKDFSINILPSFYAADAPASGETVLHRDGFPLRPVSRVCH
jgi:hypothetical protein